MVSEITLGDLSVANAVHALAQSAYRLEAEQIGCVDFPPLRETVEQLRASPDRFLVFREGEKIVGVLSFFSQAERVTITRLFVSPQYLRKGIAQKLHDELIQRLPRALSLTVSTAQRNLPALSFYNHLGYAQTSSSQSVEGIASGAFHKDAPGMK